MFVSPTVRRVSASMEISLAREKRGGITKRAVGVGVETAEG